MRNLALVLVAIAAGVAGLWLGGAWRLPAEQAVPEGVVPVGPGDPVPMLSLPGLDGVMQPLRPDPNRPQLINVWASWCPPCVAEMPRFDAFAAEQDDNGIEVVGIALDDPRFVQDFLDRVPVRYRNLIDTPGPADSSVWLGNTRGVLPYTVLVGADGRVVRQHMGELSRRELARFARLEPGDASGAAGEGEAAAARVEIQTSD
ncbi:MAG: TlpA disulfide reductase family protein [Xanthomonadaceae bacterium]|nr:TlpA disulfide reductase family protein [Xanthomonadaceae bacterium]